MDPVELSEDGLSLRAWRAADVDGIHRACQDPDIQRWTLIPSPYTRDDAVSFVNEIAPRGWAEDSAAAFGVFDTASGDLLGSCGLVKLDLPASTAEIGYWVAPWARRRRVAERAARAVARWAFDKLGIQRLAWHAEAGNHASRLVAERIGCQIEGTLRAAPHPRGTHHVDLWVGSLLPGELTTATGQTRRAATFMAPQPELTATAAGGPVTLRRPTVRDLDAVVATARDPESVRWTTVPHPYQRSDAEWFVMTHIPQKWTRGSGACFGIYDADDTYCGSLDLDVCPFPPDVGDVGFLVAPWARGRGYASTALRAMCEWGFEAFGLERIEWRAYVGNIGSRRTAEKVGFRVEGEQRRHLVQRGERRNCWVAALLPTDLP